MQFLMFLKHPKYEKRQVRFLGWFKNLKSRQSFQKCFLFVLEIYGNTALEKSNRRKAEESTLAWSAEGKPRQSTTKHLIFKHRCAASSHAQPADPQVGEVTHALPTTHSSAPRDAEASPGSTDRPPLPWSLPSALQPSYAAPLLGSNPRVCALSFKRVLGQSKG